MDPDRLAHAATRARMPRAALLLGAVLVSLVGCSAEGRSGTDSVVAVEEAQAEAAAELAEVQAALDRQVEAADEQLAAAQAAEQQAAAARQAAAEKTPAARTAATTAAGGGATAEQATTAKPVRRAAASGVAKAGVRPAQRTPARNPHSTPRSTGVEKAATAPAPPTKPVAARAPRVAPPKPVSPTSRPAAATPTTPPRATVPSTEDLDIVVAPGATTTAASDASVAPDQHPQDFSAGDRVLLTTDAGVLVREAALAACHWEVLSTPGTGVDANAPSFSVTLPDIAWRAGDAWVLQIGAHRWPVTASTLSQHAWSVVVTADRGVQAGPVSGREEASGAPARAAAGTGSATPPAPQTSTTPPPCSAS